MPPVGDHEARPLALKRPFADGTVAIDLDPLSLLSRLAASVPAKGTHTVRYAGVLASASTLRSRIVPAAPAAAPTADAEEESIPRKEGCRYRTWAELLGGSASMASSARSARGVRAPAHRDRTKRRIAITDFG